MKFALQDFEREINEEKKCQEEEEEEGKHGAWNEVEIGESFADSYVQHRPIQIKRH
jgi:hypothetical protein